ncbi:MAG TPA: DUF484 family protein [Burkholderiales bacterium]|nr:DUF484 family protein [Burkholderiales bacterium]
MKAQEVAAYLQQHTEFFEEYADMLAEITIPHPHGGRAIPISERQILALREKARQLENKLRELIQFGEENDAISEKVHRMAVSLLGAPDLARLIDAIHFNLREDFAVPHVVLRAWHPAAATVPGLDELSAVTRDFALSLTQPYCVAHPMVDSVALFGEAGPQLRSFSYLPLREREVFGLLVLASESPQRFYPEMGTVFLKRIGELTSAALWRHLEASQGGA